MHVALKDHVEYQLKWSKLCFDQWSFMITSFFYTCFDQFFRVILIFQTNSFFFSRLFCFFDQKSECIRKVAQNTFMDLKYLISIWKNIKRQDSFNRKCPMCRKVRTRRFLDTPQVNDLIIRLKIRKNQILIRKMRNEKPTCKWRLNFALILPQLLHLHIQWPYLRFVLDIQTGKWLLTFLIVVFEFQDKFIKLF